jgi:hypothetical protein
VIGSDVEMTVRSSDTIYIAGWTSNAYESDVIVVIGDDLSKIVKLCESIKSNYSGEMELDDYGLGIGDHELWVHAVDRSYGRVSEGCLLRLKVLDRSPTPPSTVACDLVIDRGRGGPEAFLLTGRRGVVNRELVETPFGLPWSCLCHDRSIRIATTIRRHLLGILQGDAQCLNGLTRLAIVCCLVQLM